MSFKKNITSGAAPALSKDGLSTRWARVQALVGDAKPTAAIGQERRFAVTLRLNDQSTRRTCLSRVIRAPDAYFSGRALQITSLAAKLRVPTIYENNAYMEVGGLMSYGENYASTTYRAAVLVDKILKGAKPADLPVEQATRLELVINRKAAKALGLAIPQSLLISAERVID